MPKIGVLLSGCGVYDGAEIHESVITLLALDRAGAEAVCMAPNIDQMHVVDHRTERPVPGETRNVLTEAARIARGNIADVADVSAADLDGLVIPGGFGAAKNLCTFAVDGPGCSVNPDVQRLVTDLYHQRKPIGAICIAPALLAKIFEGKDALTLTIGNDAGTAQAIESLGAKHQACTVDNFVVDRVHNVLTAPAYMLGPTISGVAAGIEKLVKDLVRIAGED